MEEHLEEGSVTDVMVKVIACHEPRVSMPRMGADEE